MLRGEPYLDTSMLIMNSFYIQLVGQHIQNKEQLWKILHLAVLPPVS